MQIVFLVRNLYKGKELVFCKGAALELSTDWYSD